LKRQNTSGYSQDHPEDITMCTDPINISVLSDSSIKNDMNSSAEGAVSEKESLLKRHLSSGDGEEDVKRRMKLPGCHEGSVYVTVDEEIPPSDHSQKMTLNKIPNGDLVRHCVISTETGRTDKEYCQSIPQSKAIENYSNHVETGNLPQVPRNLSKVAGNLEQVVSCKEQIYHKEANCIETDNHIDPPSLENIGSGENYVQQQGAGDFSKYTYVEGGHLNQPNIPYEQSRYLAVGERPPLVRQDAVEIDDTNNNV
jgi:hypothetical protein